MSFGTVRERMNMLRDGRSCIQCYPHPAHPSGMCEVRCGCIVAQPFVKWAGGKRQILPKLISLIPDVFGDYYEPFAGGAALFYALAPVKQSTPYPGTPPRATSHPRPWAVLNDTNDLLMNTYQVIQRQVELVIRELGKFKYDDKLYYDVRAKFPYGSPVARAAQMLYLSRVCWNGLWRVNLKGKFNVPIGKYTNPTICDADNLRAVSRVLSQATLLCEDFESVVARAKRGDFVYFDPPYVPVDDNSDFTTYTKGGFGLDDHKRLRNVALALKKRGVNVLLSNSDVPAVRELYARGGFKITAIQAKRSINSKAARRGTSVGELLIT